MKLSVGLIQISASDKPQHNLGITEQLIRDAANQGATFIATPEVTNIISTSRSHQNAILHHQHDDPTLIALQALAQDLSIWLLIGSLALKTDDPDERFANRSFLINDQGRVVQTYDKIHMFDVQVSETETYRESAGFRPGEHAVTAQTPFGTLGLSVCYDMRFPQLYRDLAQAGAQIITVPCAFSPVTGPAHYHTLLRARAIETGCYIIAPSQTGQHKINVGKGRATYGHSLIVNPWGEILCDAGTDVCANVVEIDLQMVTDTQKRIPSLSHDRSYSAPQ